MGYHDDMRAAAHALLFSRQMLGTILRRLERLGVPRRHREDVAAQVWLSALQSWPRFDPILARPESWLNGILVHVATRYHDRARRCKEELIAEHIETIDSTPDPEVLMTIVNDLVRTREALSEIPPELRSVLFLHYIHEMPMAYVAHAIGRPLFTVYKLRATARAQLRAIIERHDQERT
jgi:RNA polymerase sigma-70 factor (ECF subfamily)